MVYFSVLKNILDKRSIYIHFLFKKLKVSLQPFSMYKPGADEEKAENARLV